MIETNGHKPYACGVVLHPLIDGVIAIRNRDAIDPAAVSEVAPARAPARAVDHRRGRALDRLAVEISARFIRRPWP